MYIIYKKNKAKPRDPLGRGIMAEINTLELSVGSRTGKLEQTDQPCLGEPQELVPHELFKTTVDFKRSFFVNNVLFKTTFDTVIIFFNIVL